MKAILTYHSIDASGSPISVDPDAFRAHARWFASGRVRVVGLDELLALPHDADAVCLTFDDAFANFASAAWPLLRDHGLPVTLFVVAGYAGRRNTWDQQGYSLPELPLLDWPALGRLADEGVTLGAHTVSHPDLRTLDDDALAHELAGAADRIAAETGRRPACLAYPFGATDARVTAAAGSVYTTACTTELRALRPAEDPLRLPRLDAFYFRQPGRLEAWGSPAFRRYLGLRAVARRARRALSWGRP